jgi:hypothetical protein
MKVRLTRKLADRIDGVELEGCRVGDVLDLPSPDAQLLIAERWATPEHPRTKATPQPTAPDESIEHAS